MKERPILFSAPMVRAIMEGRKTQTRRVVKVMNNNRIRTGARSVTHITDPVAAEVYCPYGKVGDRLWVRENLDVSSNGLYYSADNAECSHDLADAFTEEKTSDYYCVESRTIPSIHMPRWASRIDLEITGVRVERLNTINKEDAIAEGLTRIEYKGESWGFDGGNETGYGSATGAYRALWESINGAGSWQQNPWVWVIEFKKI